MLAEVVGRRQLILAVILATNRCPQLPCPEDCTSLCVLGQGCLLLAQTCAPNGPDLVATFMHLNKSYNTEKLWTH